MFQPTILAHLVRCILHTACTLFPGTDLTYNPPSYLRKLTVCCFQRGMCLDIASQNNSHNHTNHSNNDMPLAGVEVVVHWFVCFGAWFCQFVGLPDLISCPDDSALFGKTASRRHTSYTTVLLSLSHDSKS